MNEDLFFPWFVNLCFSVLGKLGLNFFVICEIRIYFCVIFEPTTFAGITFHFFLEILASLKLVNYTKLDVTPACSMRSRVENWSRTNHSDSELGGRRICNHGQESWDKLVRSAFLSTSQTRIQPHLPNLAPHPQYSVENYPQFLLSFNIVLEGRGKVTRF